MTDEWICVVGLVEKLHVEMSDGHVLCSICFSRRQQHYHSQRGDSRSMHPRPVSNFYEYESVQAMMRANQQRMVDCANSNSLPRRSPQESGPLRSSVHMNGAREGPHLGSSYGGSGRSQGISSCSCNVP